MEFSAPQEIDRVRNMAQQLDCFIEEDFQSLAQATPKTVEAWRKRGQGPAYILIGRRYLYPRKAVAKYLEQLTRGRAPSAGSALL
jgi:hypothetical protein